MWAGHLVRRGWRATIFLALLAGLAGGIAMAAWSAGRRTSTVFDRFVATADPPELIVTFCPPGFVVTSEQSLLECFAYVATDELAVIENLPEVETAGRASFRGLEAARPGEPDRTWLAGSSLVVAPGIASFDGQPILVAGRLFSPQAADEAVVNERFVEQSGVAIGEELDLTFWAPDEIGTVPAEGVHLTGPTARVRVVGVVRSIIDLDAPTNDVNRIIDEARVTVGPALAAATNDAAGFGGIAVNARDGDGPAAAAALERSFPDRMFNVSEAVGEDELAPIREAIRYEARAALAFAAIAAAAVAVFVGQAVARQSRREWVDLPTLRALGMSSRDVRSTALLRGAVIGVAAAVAAAVVAVALSPLGPIGVGRDRSRKDARRARARHRHDRRARRRDTGNVAPAPPHGTLGSGRHARHGPPAKHPRTTAWLLSSARPGHAARQHRRRRPRQARTCAPSTSPRTSLPLARPAPNSSGLPTARSRKATPRTWTGSTTPPSTLSSPSSVQCSHRDPSTPPRRWCAS